MGTHVNLTRRDCEANATRQEGSLYVYQNATITLSIQLRKWSLWIQSRIHLTLARIKCMITMMARLVLKLAFFV
jgi:hypothetical protein